MGGGRPRVLRPGDIVCVYVGDATRPLDEGFRVFANHARVIEAFERRGFDPLPDVLRHKPANSAAKVVGSGMLPPNAAVSLEHEYILVFRKGGRRGFEPKADRRYESAYFWEERNRWFTDGWTDIGGEFQDLPESGLRDRSAAFPFEIPYRLVNMCSVDGDTVLDPFWSTGTTSLAAMVAGRTSVGAELESEFHDFCAERVTDLPSMSPRVVAERLRAHRDFVERESPDALGYEAEYYDTRVGTRQERQIGFCEVSAVADEIVPGAEGDPGTEGSTPIEYRVTHDPVADVADVLTGARRARPCRSDGGEGMAVEGPGCQRSACRGPTCRGARLSRSPAIEEPSYRWIGGAGPVVERVHSPAWIPSGDPEDVRQGHAYDRREGEVEQGQRRRRSHLEVVREPDRDEVAQERDRDDHRGTPLLEENAGKGGHGGRDDGRLCRDVPDEEDGREVESDGV
ncbi:MAG: DNA methyltransferase, partial [Haloarculaceae archaeon]